MIRTLLSRAAAIVRGPAMEPRAASYWQTPRTLAELGTQMAGWLSGGITERPGYAGPCDVDEDLAPGLTDTLVAACHAGYVTDQSQPAWADGAMSAPAAVVGFCDDQVMQELVQLARHKDLSVIACRAPATRRYVRRDMFIFAPRTVGDLRDSWTGYGLCHPDAVTALVNAWQVEISDPESGRNDRLWPALKAWAEQRQHARQTP